MALFESEKKRVSEASSSYAQKYPLSDNISNLQASVNVANLDLVSLRNDQPETAGGKRVRQRNITALSNRIMQLQNKIKDLQSGMSGGDIIKIAYPSFSTLPKLSTQTLLGSTPYSFQIPTLNMGNSNKNLAKSIIKSTTTDATDLADSIANNNGIPVGGEVNGAQGDYPPPYGVQSSKNKSILLYGGLAAIVGITAYFMFIKKK
jgi:hypothetical protein